MWESCWTMPLVGGFSWGSPVSLALSFWHCSILILITLIGSQNLDVKSHPNLFTHSNALLSDVFNGRQASSPIRDYGDSANSNPASADCDVTSPTLSNTSGSLCVTMWPMEGAPLAPHHDGQSGRSNGRGELSSFAIVWPRSAVKSDALQSVAHAGIMFQCQREMEGMRKREGAPSQVYQSGLFGVWCRLLLIPPDAKQL
ncbi:hypothetical protein PR048_004946 [Dryococelus australis]|uniref:Uncharacterized protein n=1 Tax=Dryococelus australis TaxID=614101 RepID=A0ABQ9I6U1_9NEOP|nr:hypothetical protein PR048_004946 [Dryococelus australis]